MTVAESPPSSSSFSMDDVTSKIAYAYAKQQVFVLLALVGAVTGALLILEEWPSSSGDTYLGLVDDVILLLGSVGILALVFTQRDLKRINRHAVAVLGVLLLIKVLVVALSAGGLYRVEDSADLGDDIGIPIVLGLALASYPFPVRKGGKNLFAPADIRALSNARTLVFAALVAAVASISAFSDPSEALASGPLHMPFVADDLSLLVLGIAGFVIFLVMKNGEKLVKVLTIVAVLGLVLAVVGVAAESTSASAIGDDLPKVVAYALGVLVVFALSPKLNQGRTIVDRRA